MRNRYVGRVAHRACLPALIAAATFILGALAVPAYAGGSGWAGATAISPVNQPDPTRGSQLNDVAVNPSGLTIAAWDQYTYSNGGGATIGAAVQSGGKWGAPFTVSGTAGFSMAPKVAVGADGTLAVSWTYQDPSTVPSPQQRIQVAVKPANASAWTTTTLASGPIGGVAITQFVPVGVDGNGNVTAAWSIWNGTIHLVQAATMPKGGSWSAPVSIAPALDGIDPALAMNANGAAAVAFSVSPYATVAGGCVPSPGTCALYAYRGGPGGSWSTPVQVSETIPNTVGYVTNPLLGLDVNGLATVVYMGYGVEATRQVAAGSWIAPASVIQPNIFGASYTSPDLAVDSNGNAVVAVSVFDPTINVDRASVWVAQGTANGAWSAQQRITDPTVPVDAYATRVAVSPDGSLAMVGWIDHYHGTVQVSKWTGTAWGGATTIGRGTAFSSFQEVLGLDAGSGTVARAVWKNAKTGTQTMAANYGG